jgi:hypothetical protein
MPTVTNEVIEAAIAGFEGQKHHIDAQIAELRAMLNGGHAAPSARTEATAPKRKFSAAAVKRMREAQQRRWAKVRGESAPMAKAAAPAAKVTPIAKKPKRKLSAAGRRAIGDAQKKRWAAKKAAAKA